MPSNLEWRVVLCLLNVMVAGADALHLVILATVDMTQASSAQRQCGLVALGLSMFLSLSCALSVWLAPTRRVGCSMAVNALVFLLHAAAFVPLGIALLVEGHRVLGLLELAFAVEMIAGCVCCRIYCVKVRDEQDRKDALEIAYEQLRMDQAAIGC